MRARPHREPFAAFPKTNGKCAGAVWGGGGGGTGPDFTEPYPIHFCLGMHRIMGCQQLPSLSQSIFQSSFLFQLVIPTPSEVLLLSLLSLSLSLSSLCNNCF